jgi:pilus assembly protein CpaC
MQESIPFGTLDDYGPMVSAPLTTFVVLLQMIAGDHAPAVSRHPAETTIGSSDVDSNTVGLGLNEAMAIELSADIREILIADQDIVKVVLRSTRRVYLVGKTVGKTNVYFYDSTGDQIGALDVWVSENLESPASDTEESQQRDPVTNHFLNELRRFGY